MRHGIILTALILSCFAAGCRRAKPPPPPPTGPTPAESAEALGALTGRAPVRFAWLEESRLYYFDTVQPAPPRMLRDSPTQQRPVFTPDGAAVLVTDDGQILAITPATGHTEPLGAGHAIATVRVPEPGLDWVYATETPDGRRLFRFPLREPGKREPVSNGAPVDPLSAQISRDGYRLTGRFFGGDGGSADTRDQKWVKISGDRPIALAPDQSHIAAMLDGTGRRLRFFHPSGEPWNRDSDDLVPPARWKAEIPEAPWAGIQDRFTGLRWSHHPRFLALAESGRPGPARLALARLSPNAGEIEALAVLAAAGPNVRAFDAWVGGGASASLADWPASPESFRHPETDDNGSPLRWPRTLEGVTFIWDTRHAVNQLPGRDGPCRLYPRGTARFGEWGDLLLDGGVFVADDASARAVATAASAANTFVIQLFVTESVDEEGPLSTRLAALQLDGDRDAFSLSRVDQALVFRALLDPGDGSAPREYQSSISPVAVTPARPFHLLVELRNGLVTWIIDGQTIGEPQAIGPASLAGWRAENVTRLVFGDDTMRSEVRWRKPPDHDREVMLADVGWRARLEKILFLDRTVTFNELRDDRANAAASTTRRPGSIIHVSAILREIPALPEPAPGATALVQQVYEINEVISGQLNPGPLAVWHWATLDGQPAPSRPTEIGATYDLRISPLRRHPETELEATYLGEAGVPEPGYLDVAPPRFPATLTPPVRGSIR